MQNPGRINSMDIFDTEYNPNWEENWKSVVQTDQNTSSIYLIRLMTHKLFLMLNYLNDSSVYDEYSGVFGTRTDKMISEINKCYELGLKIISTDYLKPSREYLDDNENQPKILKCNRVTKEFKEWSKIDQKCQKNRKKDIEKFFRETCKYVNSWWV